MGSEGEALRPSAQGSCPDPCRPGWGKVGSSPPPGETRSPKALHPHNSAPGKGGENSKKKNYPEPPSIRPVVAQVGGHMWLWLTPRGEGGSAVGCGRHQDVTFHEELLCSWRAAGPNPSFRRHPPARRTESSGPSRNPGRGLCLLLAWVALLGISGVPSRKSVAKQKREMAA